MGFKRGLAVISPQAREPSPHLCLLPASLIKCGLWAERAQRPLCRWRTQTLLHKQFTLRQELVWLQKGGQTQADYHVSVWQCVFLRCDLSGKRLLPSDWDQRVADASEAWLIHRLHRPFVCLSAMSRCLGASVLTLQLLLLISSPSRGLSVLAAQVCTCVHV